MELTGLKLKNKKMIMTTELTEDKIKQILDYVNCGLVKGMGKDNKGEMCIEAVISVVLDEEFKDYPYCVGVAVRSFSIRLNDCEWNSKNTRASGLKRLAIAQLGSNKIDQVEFAKLITLKTINKLLPKLYRENPQFKVDEKLIQSLENAKTLYVAKAAANAVAHAAAHAAVYAVANAAAKAAAYAAVDAVANVAANAAAEAAADAANVAANAAADVAAYAAADDYLELSADLCSEVLIELNCEGCKYLYLCE